MSLGTHTGHKAALSVVDQMLSSLAFLSSQLLFGLYGSDAVLLSMVLDIPDLVHTYIEAMKIVRDILFYMSMGTHTAHKAAHNHNMMWIVNGLMSVGISDIVSTSQWIRALCLHSPYGTPNYGADTK